jgi:hypothetical protein
MTNDTEYKAYVNSKQNLSPPATGSNSTDHAFDEIEEKKLVRKVDWKLLPILGALYSIALIDRTNVSDATSQTPHALSKHDLQVLDLQCPGRGNGTGPPSRYWRPIHHCLGSFLPNLLPPRIAFKHCAAQGGERKLAVLHCSILGRCNDWRGLCEELDLSCHMSRLARSIRGRIFPGLRLSHYVLVSPIRDTEKVHRALQWL